MRVLIERRKTHTHIKKGKDEYRAEFQTIDDALLIGAKLKRSFLLGKPDEGWGGGRNF